MNPLSLQKLQHILFSLIILFLPTQLGKHFWPEFTLVLGRRIDYLAPTIYTVDVLLVLFFVLIFLGKKSNFDKKYAIAGISGIIYFLIAAAFSFLPLLTVVSGLRIVEFLLLLFIVQKIKPTTWQLMTFWMISAVVVAFLAIWQFLQQSSIGGFFYILGERSFSSETPGIAQMLIGEKLLLRPYATFSHPNVLGGFMLVLLPWFLFTKPLTSLHFMIKRIGLVAIFFCMLLSFGRTVWLVGGFVLFVHLVKNQPQKIKAFLPVLGILFIFAEILTHRFSFLFSIEQVSITERVFLANKAVQMLWTNPFLGVGFNNFILYLVTISAPPFLLQPVHSLYLLIASEMGLVGLVGFLFVVIKRMRKKTAYGNALLFSLVLVLLLGFWDHYFITQPQTRLLFALLLGLTLVKEKTSQ